MTTVTDDEAEAILYHVVSDAELGNVSTVSRFHTGVANHVYLVNQRFVIRIGTADDGPSFPKSVAILKAIDGHVKAPAIIYDDISCSRVPFNVMIYTFIPGVAICNLWNDMSASERHHYVLGIGHELQSLHRFPFLQIDHFQEQEDWANRFIGDLEHYFELAYNKKAFSPTRLAVMHRKFEACVDSVFRAAPPAIVHNDINWSNVIVKDGDLVALLDFDDAKIAPPEDDYWALIRMLVEKGESPRIAMNWIDDLSPGLTKLEGFRERCLLRQVYEILWNATTHYSWESASSALAEANAQFHDTFERRVFDSWFSE